MLSREGNAGERWKTTKGLISKTKKQLCTCSWLFLYISLPLFCTTTTWNFQKLLSCTFYGGNFVRVLVHLFFLLPLIIILHWCPLPFLILSPQLQNFHVVPPTKKCLLRFFLSRSRSLSPFFSSSFAGLQPDFHFFSVFLLLYIPNLWTCGTMNLSWIL